jgi:hypothetical protein
MTPRPERRHCGFHFVSAVVKPPQVHLLRFAIQGLIEMEVAFYKSARSCSRSCWTRSPNRRDTIVWQELFRDASVNFLTICMSFEKNKSGGAAKKLN